MQRPSVSAGPRVIDDDTVVENVNANAALLKDGELFVSFGRGCLIQLSQEC